MKQPRAHTQQRHSSKKSILPVFRQPRTVTTKLNDFSISNKNELFFNTKLIPFEIIAERKVNDTLRVLIGWSELSLFDNNRNVKIPLSIDQENSKDWIVINFGENLMAIKLKRPGDDNVLVCQANLISWERNELLDKRIGHTINLKELTKSQKINEFVFPPPVNTIKDDKTKQMKAFVSNLMSKKIIRKIGDKNEESLKIMTKKNATLSKDKKSSLEDQEENEGFRLSKHNLLSACNGSITLNILRSHRKDIIDRNKLKNSKFTGNSEKETSVGDQSIFMNQKVNANITLMSNENGNYSRMKMKFDSQPYFYQNSTITSQFSHNQNSTQNQIFFSRHEFPQRQDINVNFNSQNNTECLRDKSEHDSEEEVEEEIVRSAMRNSSVVKEDDGFSFVKKDKTGKEESECFESKQLESSEGTIYESKYE